MRISFHFTIAPALSLVCLAASALASAQVQTFTAAHTYIMGNHDSKDDARQRCVLEAKRKILEQAGVYIESASEVKNFDLTKDTITSFAAAVMQVQDTKEEVGFQQGHMTLTLKLTAQVDLAEVRKQLAVRQLDVGMREDVAAAQKERLKHLEAQFVAMLKQQQGGQSSGHAPASPPNDISIDDLQRLHERAARGDASAQVELGLRYGVGDGVVQDYALARHFWERAAAQGDAQAQFNLGMLYRDGQGVSQDYAKAGRWYEQAAAQGHAEAQGKLGMLYRDGQGVPQDYTKARQWFEKAVAQGVAQAQNNLGLLYYRGQGVPQNDAMARQWFEKAAAQGDATARQWFEQAAAQDDATAQYMLGSLYYRGNGVPQDDGRAYMWFSLAAAHSTGELQKMSVDNRDKVVRNMTPAQIAEAQRLAQQCQAQQFKGC
jgi:TPR repeat protein